jgi:transcriptional regulator with XRE-family HTH domain
LAVKARGLTAKEVAAQAGLAQQTISRIELGQHDVVFSTLEKILAAMGYTLEDILPDEPAETPATVTE